MEQESWLEQLQIWQSWTTSSQKFCSEGVAHLKASSWCYVKLISVPGLIMTLRSSFINPRFLCIYMFVCFDSEECLGFWDDLLIIYLPVILSWIDDPIINPFFFTKRHSASKGSEALKAALLAAGRKTVWFDPVSVAKAPRGAQSIPWHLAAPNWDELLAMLNRPNRSLEWQDEVNEVTPSLPNLMMDAVADALVPGFGFADNLLLTLGPRGCVLAGRNPTDADQTSAPCILQTLDLDIAGLVELDTKPPKLSIQLSEQNHLGYRLRWYRLLHPLEHVRDVTGAGDALLAGAAAAFVAGWELVDSVFLGLVCAHLTLFVDGSVVKELQPEILPKLAQQLKPQSRL